MRGPRPAVVIELDHGARLMLSRYQTPSGPLTCIEHHQRGAMDASGHEYSVKFFEIDDAGVNALADGLRGLV